jgi:hypothetical protein
MPKRELRIADFTKQYEVFFTEATTIPTIPPWNRTTTRNYFFREVGEGTNEKYRFR